jgi:CRISPR-associated protein Cmr2
MKQYMLMFSLGPVQPFIEQARKTRDLWLGSYLLARLMAAAMKEVEEAKLAAEFVFPTERKLNDKYSNLPNKYIAIFNKLPEAQAAVEFSKKGIRESWSAICTNVRDAIVAKHMSPETRIIWDGQTDPDTLFEIFWVIVEGDPERYSDWLQSTEAALDARKRLRNFQPREEPGEKSTISGERQALHGALVSQKDKSTRQQVKEFWIKLASNPSISAKVISKDGSERLDAIDTVKRFATESPLLKQLKQTFPSTSSIATAPFVERLLTINPNRFQGWLKATDGPLAKMPPDAILFLEKRAGAANKRILQRDGDCYFAETFVPRRLEEDYALSQTDAKNTALAGRQGLKELLEVTDENHIRRPTPYYAIMKMDGDHMGRLLSSVYSQDEHISISSALSNFSRKIVPQLVEEQYPGRLVYAGGDDVLALIPLAMDILEEERNKADTIYTLFDLVYQLQQQYREVVQKEVADDHKQEVRASTGIAIAHHFTPLSAVLRATREAEKLAKDHYGRNALVITVMRRSGAQTRVGCHWEYNRVTKEAQPIRLFSRFYGLFDQDVLSPKCIYNLLEEAPTLIGLERDAQASEIKRVMLRQRDVKNKNMLPDNEVAQLAGHVVELAAAMDEAMDNKNENKYRSTELHADELRYGLIETLGWLLVMVFLARKEQD